MTALQYEIAFAMDQSASLPTASRIMDRLARDVVLGLRNSITLASIHKTNTTNQSAFFNALAVIVVPLLDALFKRKALGPRELGSVALAIAGVGLLELGPSSPSDVILLVSTMMDATASSAPAHSIVSVGDVFCLGQALFFGIGYWRLGAASVAYPSESARLTAGQLAAVAVGAVLYWLVADGVTSAETVSQQIVTVLQDPFVWKALVWTGLISTALAIYLETVALAMITATELTVLMTSISLWGSAFSYLLTGEVLPAIGMLGGLLILAGCILTATTETTSD